MAYWTLGREEEARSLLEKLEALEKAYLVRDAGLSYLLGNVFLDNLIIDPRWPEFLQKRSADTLPLFRDNAWTRGTEGGAK